MIVVEFCFGLGMWFGLLWLFSCNFPVSLAETAAANINASDYQKVERMPMTCSHFIQRCIHLCVSTDAFPVRSFYIAHFFLFIVALFLSPSNSMNVKIMYSHPDWFRFISFAKNKPKRNESRCLGSHANIRYSFGGGWSHRQFVLHFGWICSTFIFVIFAVYFTLSTRPMPSSCTH